MDPELQALAVQLADAAVRNTATAVADRIGAARARRKDQETIAELEQIVNDLIDDKSELVRIAQAFEQQLVAQKLSPDDVQYIASNIVPVLRKLAEAGSADAGAAASVQEMMDLLKPILSVETVTVLQIIGFNFREAIGTPLTELVSRLILSRMQSDTEIQRLLVQRDLAYLEVAQDPDAYSRLLSISGRT